MVLEKKFEGRRLGPFFPVPARGVWPLAPFVCAIIDPLQPALGKASREDPREAYLAIERFLKASQIPVLMEPGEDPLAITLETFVVTTRGSALTIECWNDVRNVTRRVTGIRLERPGRLELEIERFGGRAGVLSLIDMGRAANHDATRRGARLKYRERFRQSLHRQFPDWRIAELSAEQDLEHSLSPSYPRALLRKGQTGLAAIGAPEDASQPEEALTFGLIWLDYLRHREQRLVIEGLAVFVPADTEASTCHRVRYLNPAAAQFLVYIHETRLHDSGGWEQRVNPGDYTNLDTRLEPQRRPLAEESPQLIRWAERIGRIDGVERRARQDGSVSFAVRGLEFARAGNGEIAFGLDRKRVVREARSTGGDERPLGETYLAEVEELARGIARVRHADAADPRNPLYTRHPEKWLESQVRVGIEAVDATLLPSPDALHDAARISFHDARIYGQVPEMAGGARGILDLLAVDRAGRLAILELKASQDIHLPLQGLDYWMRVKWHLDRGEFAERGYFPGIALSKEAPRLLLVAPALEWHPTNEVVLRYLDPGIDIQRIGIGLKWRRGIEVMFRTEARRH